MIGGGILFDIVPAAAPAARASNGPIFLGDFLDGKSGYTHPTAPSEWVPLMPGVGDLADDQQTGSVRVSQDIVGTPEFSPAYVWFGDIEIAFRVRVNGIDGNYERNQNSTMQFSGFVWIGIDATLDGSIDFFIGCYDPTGNSGRLGIYGSDPKALNNGPSTTGISNKPVSEFKPVAAWTNNPQNTTRSANGNYSLDIVKYSTSGYDEYPFPSFSGHVNGSATLNDYYISFKFTLAQINSALAALNKDRAANNQLTPFTSNTTFRAVVGTGANDKSFNQDVLGMDKNEWRSGRTWTQIGVFSPPISEDSFKPPYYINFVIDENDYKTNPEKYSNLSGFYDSLTVDRDNGVLSVTPPSDPASNLSPTPGYVFLGWQYKIDGNGNLEDLNLDDLWGVPTDDFGNIIAYAKWGYAEPDIPDNINGDNKFVFFYYNYNPDDYSPLTLPVTNDAAIKVADYYTFVQPDSDGLVEAGRWPEPPAAPRGKKFAGWFVSRDGSGTEHPIQDDSSSGRSFGISDTSENLSGDSEVPPSLSDDSEQDSDEPVDDPNEPTDDPENGTEDSLEDNLEDDTDDGLYSLYDQSFVLYSAESNGPYGPYEVTTFLYARWENLPSITITFNPDGGTFDNGGTSEIIVFDGKFPEPPVVTKAYHTFAGWKDSSGRTYKSGDPVDNNLEVYAIWEPLPLVTIIFDPNGGDFTGSNAGNGWLYKPDKKTYTTTALLSNLTGGFKYDFFPPATPQRYSFTFTGWSFNPDGIGTIISRDTDWDVVRAALTAALNGDKSEITLHAAWVRTHKVSGTVEDENGIGIEDADVEIFKGSELVDSTRTDGGKYEIYVPDGVYNLVVIHPDGQPIKSKKIIVNGEELKVDPIVLHGILSTLINIKDDDLHMSAGDLDAMLDPTWLNPWLDENSEDFDFELSDFWLVDRGGGALRVALYAQSFDPEERKPAADALTAEAEKDGSTIELWLNFWVNKYLFKDVRDYINANVFYNSAPNYKDPGYNEQDIEEMVDKDVDWAWRNLTQLPQLIKIHVPLEEPLSTATYLAVYRRHNVSGTYEIHTLPESTVEISNPPQDLEYFVRDSDRKGLTMYVKKFSEYAIAMGTKPAPPADPQQPKEPDPTKTPETQPPSHLPPPSPHISLPVTGDSDGGIKIVIAPPANNGIGPGTGGTEPGGTAAIDPPNPSVNDTVRLTVTPRFGFERGYISITDDEGLKVPYTDNRDNTYTFKMPKGPVLITVTFMRTARLHPDSDVSRLLNTDDHMAYVQGIGGGMFAPVKIFTRAEAAQMFYNLLRDKSIPAVSRFPDVPDTAWYATAVNALSGLISMAGYPDGNFYPYALLTRAQLAEIAVRFARTSPGGARFTDVSEAHWAYASISTAVNFGWMVNSGAGGFEPDRYITRDEAVTMVNRMLRRYPDRTYIDGRLPELISFRDVGPAYWAYYDVMEAANGHNYEMNGAEEAWKSGGWGLPNPH
ncbi:MAG: S-layer homology domain-containing protein [Oscillospiraceae bacterium]|nr:S-layer homology domain-containing protein [Oscillospiraceae bacterium]